MASNVKPHQRAFALTIALIFLVTTVATSALVVMAIINENKQNNATSESTDLNTAENPNLPENALQGKKLEGFTPTATTDGLQKIDLKEGTGAVATGQEKLTLHYTGAVAATGVIFQSSKDTGTPIKTQDPTGAQVKLADASLIRGWLDGVPGMKVGGTRRLIIPADQAYGPNPPAGSGIPENAVLVFDIELVSIDQ